jgi:hypothetical protein
MPIPTSFFAVRRTIRLTDGTLETGYMVLDGRSPAVFRWGSAVADATEFASSAAAEAARDAYAAAVRRVWLVSLDVLLVEVPDPESSVAVAGPVDQTTVLAEIAALSLPALNRLIAVIGDTPKLQDLAVRIATSDPLTLEELVEFMSP